MNQSSEKAERLTHLNARDEAHMVDVGDKPITRRYAVASAVVRTRPDVIRMIADGKIPKGDVAAVARIAGIMAVKKTNELIPLCHPIPIDAVEILMELEESAVRIRCEVANTAKTGIEMEALTGASIAALAVYDMCKAVDRAMSIEQVRLEEKSGGRSGHYLRDEG